MARIVAGLYDTFDEAQRAVKALVDAGFDRDNISLVANNATGELNTEGVKDYTHAGATRENMNTAENQNLSDRQTARPGAHEGAEVGAGVGAGVGAVGGVLLGLGALLIPGIGPVLAAGPILGGLAGLGVGGATGGIIGALVDSGIPKEQANVYAEGIRRGGTLVTVRADDNRAEQAADIMNRFDPINIDQRTGQWKNKDKWQNFDEKARPYTGNEINQMRIPIVEEKMKVGKRQVEEGGVRVKKEMKTEDVEEPVNLRDESVNVQRRDVNRPATDADFNAFQEGTVEIHTIHEEPVVEKKARVVGEVDVQKNVEEHQQTVKGQVRKTDVEVQRLNQDFGQDEDMFRQHFNKNYARMGAGYDYNNYRNAYRFGYGLGAEPRYANYDWNRLEPEARQNWQNQYSNLNWNDYSGAVQEGWRIRRNRNL